MKRAFAIALACALSLPAAGARAMDAKPLLYSLIMPGLGEWSLGYKWRAVGHFAVEAGCWAGNFYYRDQGFDRRHAYEAYADAHWETARWASSFNETKPDWLSWLSDDEWDAYAWPDTIASAMEFVRDDHEDYLQSHFAPFHEDAQHYYENLGKYDWYRWGWDDYDSDADATANRITYLEMRNDSNASFQTAHRFIAAMVIARVVSLADTYLLLRRAERAGADGGEAGEGALRDTGWRLNFSPMDPAAEGFRLTLSRRW